MRDDICLKEWEVTRNVINEFDDRIHDLRKYGFSFITALLAAESLLIPGYIKSGLNQPFIPDSIKLAVMIVTLLMIVTLRVMERNYQLFIKCASQRARIIERSLNFELTEIITSRHRRKKIKKYENYIYICFAAGVGILGSIMLFPNYFTIVSMILSTVVAGIFILYIKSFDIEYDSDKPNDWTDWTIDQLECKRGDTIRITLTNLNKEKSLLLQSGEIAWEIKTQDGSLIHQEKIAKNIFIFKDGNYTWSWNTHDVEGGIFEVFPYRWNRPLRRKIIIREQDKISPV
jgi:hypothetical protein